MTELEGKNSTLNIEKVDLKKKLKESDLQVTSLKDELKEYKELEKQNEKPESDTKPETEKPEEPTPEPPIPEPPSNEIAMEQKNALSKAKDYLNFAAFSYTGLISQLEFEGFSNEDSTYAVDNCGADWNDPAAKKSQSYISMMSFSRSGLIDQLKFEEFSSEQAEHGDNSVGY